jgi:Flp pilus assembly pilin Flp
VQLLKVYQCCPFQVFGRNFLMMQRIWNEEDGVLSFEWVLLVTLLVIGIVVGVAAARDAVVDELGDVAQAMVAVDQSYTVDFPLSVAVHAADSSGASDTSFTDAATFSDCGRVTAADVEGQDAEVDAGDGEP